MYKYTEKNLTSKNKQVRLNAYKFFNDKDHWNIALKDKDGGYSF